MYKTAIMKVKVLEALSLVLEYQANMRYFVHAHDIPSSTVKLGFNLKLIATKAISTVSYTEKCAL